MNDVFISYSRRDKVFTQKLFEALKVANREVWADWDSIPAASDWDAEIKEGIEQTESVLFVLSPEWIKSNECRKELDHAAKMGKRLFPILYLPVDPNDVPPELAKINWVYMRDTDDFDKAFQTLCDAMDTDLEWVKTHTRIQVRAMEWDKKNRENSFLLHGKDLSDGEQFISQGAQKEPEPTNLQGEYVLASRKDATRRQRMTMTGVTIALVVSIALGVVAFFQRQAAVASEATAVKERDRAVSAEATAVAERDRADLNSKVSFARELTANSEAALDVDPELSILLALQANNVLQEAGQPVLPATEDALRLALQTSRLRYVVHANLRDDESMKQVPDERNSLAFSPDGKLLATGSLAGKIIVWNISHFPYPPYNQITPAGTVWLELVFTLPEAVDDVRDIAFSPDGTQMVTSASSTYHTPAVWDAKTGEKLFSLSGHKAIVSQVVFSPDGKLIATSSKDGEIIVWDASNGQKKMTVLNHTASPSDSNLKKEVGALAFSPDGKYLVSGSEDNILIASDAQTGETVYTFDTDESFVHAVAFSPDGKYLTYGSGRNTAVTFDFYTQKKVFTMKGHEHQVFSVEYSPDGDLLLSAGYDGKIVVSNAHDGSEVFVLTGDKDVHITRAVFSPDGRYIASTNYDGQLKIWDASPVPITEAGTFAAFTSPILGLDYSPDGSRLAATSDQDNVAKIWSLPLSEGKSIDLVTENYSTDIAFSPNGQTVATGSIWDGANIWDATSGGKLLNFNVEDNPQGIAFSPDGKSLGLAKETEEKALVINADTGQQLNALTFNTTPGYGTTDIAFSSDGKWFASVYNEGITQVLDLEDGKSVLKYEDHADWVTSVKFSPDGKYLLTGSVDGTAVLRDIAADKIKFRFNAKGTVLDVAFSPDGSKAATATQNGTVMIWSTADGSLLYTIQSAFSGGINNISFSPDGKILAAGGVDGRIRFSYVEFADVLALAKARITRSLTDEECQTYLHEEKCPDAVAKPQEKTKPDDLIPLQLKDTVSATVVVKSGDASTEVTLKIINNSGKRLKLDWVNFDGVEEPFADLSSGTLSQGTFETHVWRIRDLTGNLLLEYIADARPTQTIVVNADMTVAVP
jgi:WD40 repeat protein